MKTKWIGVDLDGTLAEGSSKGIGRPVPLMLERVREWVRKGVRVKILTARVNPTNPDAREAYHLIKKWLARYGLGDLEIVYAKDRDMVELWDDRAIQVEHNTGRRVDGK